MEDALTQIENAQSALDTALTDLNSQVVTEDPTWAAIQSALVNAGWTPPVSPATDSAAATAA
jgi:hypothetical protein